jgi:hypothetical protein
MDIPSALTQLLLDCLHAHPARLDAPRLAALRGEEWQALLGLARMHRVTSTLYYILKTRGLEQAVPPPQWAALHKSFLLNGARSLVYRSEIARVAGELHVRGIPLLLLKGACMAGSVYPDPAMREMGDLDFLVREEHLAGAAGVLEALGYTTRYPYQPGELVSYRHHLPVYSSPNGVHIELHWTIISLFENEPVSPGPLWERAVPTSLDGAAVFELCPEDLLLHVCGHASYHHTFELGLRSLYDVLAILQRFHSSLRCDLLVQSAVEWRWQRGVYLVLRMAAELLGAPLPPGLLPALRPQGFDETLFHTACAQILSEVVQQKPVTVPLARWHMAGPLEKIQGFWQRVFIPTRLLAAQYRLKPSSPLVYGYYPVRLVYLLKSYLRMGFHLWRGDSPAASYAERKARLLDWLREK